MPVTATVEATFLGAVSLLLCAAWTDAQGAATPSPAGAAAERTEVRVSVDSGCHIWTNADGSMEIFYYKVVPGKYEFAHDRNGQLIFLSHEHSPSLQLVDGGRYQCQILSGPTLCTPVSEARNRLPVQFGPDHRRSTDNRNGREDFWTLPGHQSLTDISNPAAWARVKATAPQYRPVDAVAHGISLHSMLTDPGANTGVCLGATWGCHSWTNPDGSRENFNYKVILGKYEFAYDSNGQLILLSHEHAAPLQVIDGGRYQCRVQVRPTLCAPRGHDPGMRSLQFGPDHKHTINNSHGREDFWTLPGHQSLTDVVDPKRWAAMQPKAPQYSGY